jgi:hypothetical protein
VGAQAASRRWWLDPRLRAATSSSVTRVFGVEGVEIDHGEVATDRSNLRKQVLTHQSSFTLADSAE